MATELKRRAGREQGRCNERMVTLALDHGVAKFANGESEQSEVSTFQGVGYSGGPASSFFGSIVIDLDGMEIPDRVPSMHNHFDRIGFADDIKVVDGKLLVSGKLLNGNEKATAIKNDADQGYPWEMSVWIDIANIAFVGEGVSIEANGRTFDGPIDVITASRLREVSIVDVGADPETVAQLASAARGINPEINGATAMFGKRKMKNLIEGLTDDEAREMQAQLSAQLADDDEKDEDADAEMADDDSTDEEKKDEKDEDDTEAKAEGESDEKDEDDESEGAAPVGTSKNAASIEQLESVPGITPEQTLAALKAGRSLEDVQSEMIVSLNEKLAAADEAGGVDPVDLGTKAKLGLTNQTRFDGCNGVDAGADWANSEQLRNHWKGNGGKSGFMNHARMQKAANDCWDVPIFDAA